MARYGVTLIHLQHVIINYRIRKICTIGVIRTKLDFSGFSELVADKLDISTMNSCEGYYRAEVLSFSDTCRTRRYSKPCFL